MKPVIIIAIAFVLLIPTSAFGAEGYFESGSTKEVYYNPTVCIFQPNDYRVTEQRWNIWYSDMKTAIDTWRSILTQSGSGIWKINIVEVPLDKLNLVNYSSCNIKVKFTDNQYPNKSGWLGWYSYGTGNISLVYLQSYRCGVEYSEEHRINVAKYCLNNDLERPNRMASVLQHEFGHALGMRHYTADNYELRQSWYNNQGFGAPSIMTPQPKNEDLKKITQTDVDLVLELYSPRGFGKEKNLNPVFVYPEVVITEPQVSDTQNIMIEPYKTSSVKISGHIPEGLYSRGTTVELEVTKPDGTKESLAIHANSRQYYEYPFVFDSKSMFGTYKILIIYKGEVVSKKIINVNKASVNESFSTNNFSPQSKLEQERAEIHQQNVEKLQKAKQEREQEAVAESQKQKETEVVQNQLKNEAKRLQSQSYNDLQLGHELENIENVLKKIPHHTTEQKETIDKAWDLLKINKQKIDDMRESKTMGDQELRSKNYLQGIVFYNDVEKDGKKVDKNLEEISKIIQQVENMKSETCFLFWCW